MIPARMKFWMFGLCAVFWSSGCARSLIPQEVRRQAATSPGFADVLARPEEYKGKTIFWGGGILGLSNSPDGTSLEILQIPLDASGEPEHRESSQGRFIARTAKYLDREIYEKNRRLTVVGKVEGKEAHPIAQGEMNYTYPLVRIERLYLWPKLLQRQPLYWAPYWPGSYWDYGCDVSGALNLYAPVW
jgi:outer membrane lipoprotein